MKNQETKQSPLNNEQKEAVNIQTGAILVVAGAGTGKTGVIVNRIQKLLETNMPESIVALTFTNKAAGEMKERLADSLFGKDTQPFIGTFHSYCLALLKQHRHLLTHPSFSILDAEDQEKLINTIIKRSNVDKRVNVKNVLHNISMYKNGLVTEQNESLFVDPLFREIVAEYQKEKSLQHCFDFDDLLLEVVKLFDKNSDFKAAHQQKIRHILVDEYQDTNIVQQILLKHMALAHNTRTFTIDSLCVVGDPDQSIYSWRGATINNILHFSREFGNKENPIKEVEIKQNYRCNQAVLDVANELILHNSYRTAQALWSSKKGRDRARILHCISGYQEGSAIAECIRAFQKKHVEAIPTIAILYRAHYQSRLIEEALIKNSILYKIVGGIEFYARKEIKDLLAYLKLIINPFDRVSFFRVINCPTRGLGEKVQELLYSIWQDNPFFTYKEITEQLIAQAGQHRTLKIESLQLFLDIIQQAQAHHNSVEKALRALIEYTDYYNYLNNQYEKDEAESKVENIKELLRAAEHFEKNGKHTIELFLEEVALVQQTDIQARENTPPVLLMSIHAAKGLEFDIVIIAGLEETVFPSTRSTISQESLEEERRLLYVAITRAKEYVLMTHAKNRASFGSVTDQLPSRFLAEISEKTAPRTNGLYWNIQQFTAYFNNWFGLPSSSHIYTVPHKSTVPTPSTNQSSTTASATLHASGPAWRIHQKVHHQTFGYGTVVGIETKDSVHTFLSIIFGNEIKKIKSSFIKAID